MSSERLAFQGELPEMVQIEGSPQDFVITRGCGVVKGTWRATDGGAFVAWTDPGVQTCDTKTTASDPAWEEFAWGYRLAGNELEFRSQDGTVEAVMARVSTTAPPVSAELSDALTTPAPVPHGLTPVTKPNQASDVWVPLSGPTSGHELSLLLNNYLGLFDTCKIAGRFTYDPTGVFIHAGSQTPGSGCASVPVAGWIDRATRLALDNDKLAFVDRSGHMLGELRRESSVRR